MITWDSYYLEDIWNQFLVSLIGYSFQETTWIVSRFSSSEARQPTSSPSARVTSHPICRPRKMVSSVSLWRSKLLMCLDAV